MSRRQPISAIMSGAPRHDLIPILSLVGVILDALGGLVQGAGFGGGPRGAEGRLTGQRRFKDLHAGMTVEFLPGNGLLLDQFVGAVVLLIRVPWGKVAT